MSQNVELLIEKLDEFNTNLQLVKKLMNRDDGNVRFSFMLDIYLYQKMTQPNLTK